RKPDHRILRNSENAIVDKHKVDGNKYNIDKSADGINGKQQPLTEKPSAPNGNIVDNTKNIGNTNSQSGVAKNIAKGNATKANLNKSVLGQEDKNVTGNKNNQLEKGIATTGKNTNNKTLDSITTPISRDEKLAANPLVDSEKKENIENKIDTTAIAAVPNALEEFLKEKEKKEVITTELKLNRWQITSNVAPIYFGSTSNGSPLDSRFESTDKTYKPSLSYGLGVQYAVNKKLAIRAGVNTVSLEYNTNDVVFYQTPNARQLQNVNTNLKGSMLEIDILTAPQTNNVFGRISNKFNGTLSQKTGYVEVPLELTYKLIDRRFGVKIIGGISTLILNQNEVTIFSPGLEMSIGEANNLNKMHYSTNIGLGLKYDIFKSLQFNIDPTFKYQINTYSNNVGDFKPYIFGIYTGLSFRF
ncbi:MAG TPA: outer membrane beta-barrel protein, partial [Flavobacterium sp.]